MPATASIEELRSLKSEIESFQRLEPTAYAELADLMRKHRRIGYKNFCKLFLGEATPEQLKESKT